MLRSLWVLSFTLLVLARVEPVYIGYGYSMYADAQCTEVIYLCVIGTGSAAGDGRIDNVHWCTMYRGCLPMCYRYWVGCLE